MGIAEVHAVCRGSVITRISCVDLRGHQGGAFAVSSLEVFCLEIEGMATVKICINWITNVGGVDGASEIVSQSQAENDFTQTL